MFIVMLHQTQKDAARSPSTGSGHDEALGNETSTVIVSNLHRHLQSHSPSVVTARPTCAGGVALHTDSRQSCVSIYSDNGSSCEVGGKWQVISSEEGSAWKQVWWLFLTAVSGSMSACCKKKKKKRWQHCVRKLHWFQMDKTPKDSTMSWRCDTRFSSVCCASFVEAFGNRVQEDNLTTVNVRRHTSVRLCVLLPHREGDRASFTPAESVTHHEACLSVSCSILSGE